MDVRSSLRSVRLFINYSERFPRYTSVFKSNPWVARKSVRADSSPLERHPGLPEGDQLKALRRQGLELTDRIKLGRKLVAPGVVQQIFNRWNTVEVAKLRCEGKAGYNMKLIVERLEAGTGGVVIHKAGGTVLLYRGINWPRLPPCLADDPDQCGQVALEEEEPVLHEEHNP